MGNAGLLYPEMLHRRGERLLILVAVGLHIIDKLKVYPGINPVPVKVVDNNILLHNTAVVAAPGQKGDVLAAPLLKLLKGIGKAVPEGETLLVKAGELLDLIMHPFKINGPYIYRKFLGRLHVLRELDRADLNNLSPELYGELVEYGGF